MSEEKIILVRLEQGFAKTLYKDLSASSLKPFFAVLDRHGASLLSDYRDCVGEFKRDYGRMPHKGYYEMVRESFNRNALATNFMLILRCPADAERALLNDLVPYIESVESTTPPRPVKPRPDRAHMVDSALDRLRKGPK